MRRNSLQIIQKFARVFRTLSSIGAIAALLGAVTAFAGAAFLEHLRAGSESMDAIASFMQALGRSGGLTLAVLLADGIDFLAHGAVFYLAARYLARELSDGTPFTMEGAGMLRRLGVCTIVLPLISFAVQAVIFELLSQAGPADFDNAGSVVLGLAMIFGALVLEYGASLAGGQAQEYV